MVPNFEVQFKFLRNLGERVVKDVEHPGLSAWLRHIKNAFSIPTEDASTSFSFPG